MKKSEFKASIKEEILGILEAITVDDVKTQKAYNAELEKTQQLMKESEDDKEPTASQLKGDSISKISNKLGETTLEMRKVVNRWTKSEEGPAKDKLKNRLKELSKIKKELEGLL